ncbi:GNAT family N-acetyltransferase [Nitrincola sp. MINF-07-Sa-05]|uniref:GNAT family N-acetyltransferase n=1 Tax=Nitrincola salilacus TaxID=3400273 RepID=UPI003917DE42
MINLSRLFGAVQPLISATEVQEITIITDLNSGKIINCNPEHHLDAVCRIFNHAIEHTTALYEYDTRSIDQVAQWFEAKASAGLPVIGIESEAGELMGFGSYGSFRPQAAFRSTVEHSVYIDPRFQGKGLGRRLLMELIDRARSQGYHLMVAAIDHENHASIALHRSLGFTHAGTIEQAAYKFERWLDLDFYRLPLRL